MIPPSSSPIAGAGLRLLRPLVVAGWLAGAAALAQPAGDPLNDQYVPGPDSRPQPGVPQGSTFQFVLDHSRIFPGSSRSVTVYVPAQYRSDKPACVYVALDALGFAAPAVFDNLISRGEMPVTIGIGVASGRVDSAQPPADPRFNRSMEFDGMNGNLAAFVLEEVLPEVERRQAPDGRRILLSRDPNDRCAGGGSTGGIAAFSLAWERPDEFRRVFTAIGTFVGMRGGDAYPVLIRKTEPKPIRVFIQDGSHDEWMGGPEVGDWWIGNQAVQRALDFAGYQVKHVWGEGTHSGKQAESIFPDAMRWLWKDWPKPVVAGESQNKFLQQVLKPGEGWRPVAGDYGAAAAVAAAPNGEVFFQDALRKTLLVARDGGAAAAKFALERPGRALSFDRNGHLYVAEADQARVVSYDARGWMTVIASGIDCRGLVVTRDGSLYLTGSGERGAESDRIWLVRPGAAKVVLAGGLHGADGIALSPDGLWLAVAENRTHFGYSYRVLPDGTLDDGQQFYWFHTPDWASDSGARAWCMDREGRLYGATRLGVQVFDRNGRSRAILPVPGGEATDLCFGGANFDTLYVTSAGKVYRRKMKVPGAPPWAPPIAIPEWSAG